MCSALTSRLVGIHTRRAWWLIAALAALSMVVVPLLNTLVAPESSLHVPNYMISLLGKFLCFALVALAIDLIWGYTGILSLGHGIFFALGARPSEFMAATFALRWLIQTTAPVGTVRDPGCSNVWSGVIFAASLCRRLWLGPAGRNCRVARVAGVERAEVV